MLERGPLVATSWLAAHLDDADTRIVDVRGKVLPPGNKPRYLPKRDDSERAHIPGAVFVDWTSDIVDPDDPVPVQVAPPAAFAAKMDELGIGDTTLVIAYDDYRHVFAGRFAWALRYYGHHEVRVLDGGFAKWVSEGRATSSEPTQVVRSPGAFHARPRASIRRTADQVQSALGSDAVLIIDARPSDQYAGSVSAAGRGGHIPGALNVPYPQLVDDATGTFRPERELAQAFRSAGVDPDALPSEIIVYCNGGVTCTVPLMALEILGRKDVAVYDGSWNEWGNDPSRPVNSGPNP